MFPWGTPRKQGTDPSFLGHFPGLCLLWATLRDEAACPPRKGADSFPLTIEAIDSPISGIVFCKATHHPCREPLWTLRIVSAGLMEHGGTEANKHEV